MTRADDLIEFLDVRNGVAHSSALRAAGFTTHEMSQAVVGGAVRRVRRSWLIAPSCPPELERAASLGGRVTCLTAAQRKKWWTPQHHDLHIAVAGTASRLDADGCRVHWSSGPAPVVRTSVADHVVNVLFHVARCVPLNDAAMVWESAIRLDEVAPEMLRRVLWRSEAAARLAVLSGSLSDSGLETRFVWIMRPAGVAVRQQVTIDGHPVDGLIGERLVIQIDGFAHHQAADRRRDIAADARLALMGYTVLRFDYYQVLFEPDNVRATVLLAMAQGLHLAA